MFCTQRAQSKSPLILVAVAVLCVFSFTTPTSLLPWYVCSNNKNKVTILPYFCDYTSRSLPDTHYSLSLSLSAERCLSKARNAKCLYCLFVCCFILRVPIHIFSQRQAHGTQHKHTCSFYPTLNPFIQVYRIEPICSVALFSSRINFVIHIVSRDGIELITSPCVTPSTTNRAFVISHFKS